MPRITKILAVAAALAGSMAAAPAHAEALPKSMHGLWCMEEGDTTMFARGKCNEKDSRFFVKPNAIEGWEFGCDFSSPIATRVGKLYDSYGRYKAFNVYEVKAKCGGEGETYNATLYFDHLGDGKLEFRAFADNELPESFVDKSMCKFDEKRYAETDAGYDCERGVSLRFERDRYTISDRNGESVAFCRYSSVKTVWDPELYVATKLYGGHVTYVTAQCPRGQKTLKMFSTKGTIYVEDKGK